MITKVVVSTKAQRQLRRVPKRIASKLRIWISDVEHDGLENVRRLPGFHDEPLHGNRKGQRSIRLSLHYRAVYIICDDGQIECVSVEEVIKHDY